METLKVSELRIGNYVKMDGLNRPIKVSIIDTTETSITTKCKPIPLTEEWLLNLGFEQNGDISYKLRKTGFVILVFGGIFKHNVTGKKFKYVHKLQNFYYELKDEELILKNNLLKKNIVTL